MEGKYENFRNGANPDFVAPTTGSLYRFHFKKIKIERFVQQWRVKVKLPIAIISIIVIIAITYILLYYFLRLSPIVFKIWPQISEFNPRNHSYITHFAILNNTLMVVNQLGCCIIFLHGILKAFFNSRNIFTLLKHIWVLRKWISISNGSTISNTNN